MIDISDIHIVKMISELGSINRAADALHMSQPTLSKKISRLEQKLKMELFSRHSGGMVPTAAAKLLLKESEGLTTQLQIIERQLELMANMVGGQIHIGVGPIVEQVFLSKVLLDYAKKDYPFRLSIVTNSPAGLIEQLKSSQIDLAIGPFQVSEVPENFTAVLEHSEKLVMIARAEHEVTKHPIKNIKELKHYRYVCPSMPKQMGNEIQDLIGLSEITPSIKCENYTLAKTVVSNSNYITIGPESLFQTEIADGTLAKVEFPIHVPWRCNCLAKPETLLMPAVKEVVQLFSQYMPSVKE